MKLYEIKLHELLPVTSSNYIEVLRVPGGWIYTTYSATTNDVGQAGYVPSSVFVPLGTISNTVLATI